MANWKAEVFENEFLAADATDVHAIVSVECSNSGSAGASGGGSAAEPRAPRGVGTGGMVPTGPCALRSPNTAPSAVRRFHNLPISCGSNSSPPRQASIISPCE